MTDEKCLDRPSFLFNGRSAQKATTIDVYKRATCGCCAIWVKHLQQHGFTVKTTDVTDMDDVKRRNKVPASLTTCHTGVVGNYVIEGHVPAEDIKRLLKERPAVTGIGVAGMPIGSPGMEGANPQAYDALSFDVAGKTAMFASHKP